MSPRPKKSAVERYARPEEEDVQPGPAAQAALARPLPPEENLDPQPGPRAQAALAQPPAVAQPSAVARLAQPAPAAQQTEDLPDPKRQSLLGDALDFAPAIVSGIGLIAGGAKGTAETRQHTNALLQQATQSQQANELRYQSQLRANARNRQQQAEKASAAKRQASLDQVTFDKAGREKTTFDQSQGERAEMHDPNSEQNKLFRQSLPPEVRAQLPEGMRDTLTMAQGDALAPLLESLKGASDEERKKRLIEFQQQMEQKYYTAPPSNNIVISAVSSDSIESARGRLRETFKGQAPAAYEARLDNVRNLPPKDQGAAIDQIMKDAASSLPKAKDAGAADAPPNGYRVRDTPGDKASWARALQDGQGRKQIIAAQAIPAMQSAITRMRELRKKAGVNWTETPESSEFEQLRIAAIGHLNAVANAGVLNKDEAERWAQRIGNLKPRLKDAQRMVGAGDPMLAELDGLEGASKIWGANIAGTLGLEQVGPSTGQQVLSERSGADEIVQVRNAAGETKPVKRKFLDKAAADGFKPVQ